MGGSGGDAYLGGGSGGGDDSFRCEDLVFTATLNAPPTPVVAAVGEVLDVQIIDVGGGNTAVGAVNSGGNVVGTITDRLPSLLQCLEEGVAFEAVVKRAIGTTVFVVEVRPA